ncbi:MG2 domain-containing protein [uncultured Chryseobacterium sp.]|uniref:alpha-2-macroglobulin family protein n=1 Tax=uncultured Chryseobacterium sp. TaxID=259322 RepID=UPI0025FCFA22|nr:MG2 domain-containing protein [uncultured Chryseobacterium sp.]
MKINSKCLLLFLAFFSYSVFYAQDFYDQEWKKVAEGYRQGEFKSSLPLILNIQQKAIKDKNAVEIIRSLKAEFVIYKTTQDDPKNDYASVFFSKIRETENLLKGEDLLLFKVLELEFFEDYFNLKKWDIQKRTNLEHTDIAKIESWTKLDYKNFYTRKFQELTKIDGKLKKVKLDQYKDAFKAVSSFDFYPTLYDWKVKKNIDFLQEQYIFTKDELKENQPKVLSLYQDLINGNDGNPKLYFQHQKLIFENQVAKRPDFYDRLKDLAGSPVKGDYKIMIVKSIAEELQRKSKFPEAVNEIEMIKKEYPDSKFSNNITSLENDIKRSFLYLTYDLHNEPEKPIQLVAKHKNLNDFEIKIYQVNNVKKQLQYLQNLDYEEYYKKIDKSLLRTDNFILPNRKDYIQHATALEMNPLPKGLYIGEYINGKDISKFLLIVTSSRVIFDKNKDYILVSRDKGEPLPNTRLLRYDFRDYSQIKETEILIQTDNFARFAAVKEDYDENPYLIYDPVSQDFNLLNSEYIYRDRQNPYPADQIFLDRAIYRPGQTVHYKIISTRPDYKKLHDVVIPGNEHEIFLYDANHQVVESKKFRTNEFGSFSGTFTLPKDKLNGTFSLRTEFSADDYTNGGYKSFSVEEYKRPKFEIVFDTIKSDYKYGQTIEIKGKAVSFSGIALNNTKINFEIKRENIRSRYFWWYAEEYNNENPILETAETNEKGEFVLKLTLKKDENKEGLQVHNYRVKASATDINGETQSAETDVKVASVSHYLIADKLDEVFAEEEVKLNVESFNYNDIPLDKSYQVKLVQLKQPERVLRDNFKDNLQDLPLLSKEEFLDKFPHDRYDKYEDRKYWQTLKTIIDHKTWNGKALNLGKLEPGDYRLLIYNTENKDTIKTEQDFSVWDKTRLGKDQYPFLKIIAPKEKVKRGSVQTIYAYSAIPDALVNVYVQDGTGNALMERKKFTNGILAYRLPVSRNKEIVKYNIQFVLAHYNDVQNKFASIVIEENKEALNIELTTFRDKVQPNSKEKWSIRVLGPNKEKVVAEVLANMYDKSLDKFAKNEYSWTKMYRPKNHVMDYEIRNYLQSLNWVQKINYLESRQVVAPLFQWFDEEVFRDLLRKYNLTVDTDGDGVDDIDDACPTVPGLEAYNGCPKPKRVTAEEVVSKRSMANLRFGDVDHDGVLDKDDMYFPKKSSAKEEAMDRVQVRRNLNETAFFYPHLRTDANGNMNFEFTTPEALTKWKLMFLAHTKDTKNGILEKDIVTQKKLSVTPNYPRFLREGDKLNFQAKISNLSDKAFTGDVSLKILDAATNEDVSSLFGIAPLQKFSADKNGNTAAGWNIKVPFNRTSSVIIKVVAKAGSYSDGEQIPVAVLSNRMLMTDAVPVFVKEGQTKTFTLDNLKNNISPTAVNFSNTLELKTNPVWEIIFALPDLNRYIKLSSDAWFNSWFGDVVGSEIFKANPRMKAVFDEYKTADILKSNLEKNQELKQVLLEETPWVLQSQSETENMNAVSRLFEVNEMNRSINEDWSTLLKYQNGDGGFPWLQGYDSSYSNSLYILRNLGKMNAWLKDGISGYQQSGQKEMVSRLIGYIDGQLERYWKEDENDPWSNFALDYLDSRLYWEKEYPVTGKGQRLKEMIIIRADKFKVTDLTFYGLHRAALIYQSYGLKDTARKLIRYLKETSTSSETQGIYWKKNLDDWGWYSSKAINHAGAIEALSKIDPADIDFIEEAKVWLATQKEANSWGNSRTTAEIIYIMMNSGKSWTTPEADKATVIWGGKEISPQTKTTGYLKQIIKSDKVDTKLSEVTVTKPGPGIVQGGLFWQYYEDLSHVRSTETYISMTREYYKKIQTANGGQLIKISENSPLKIGDRLTVRMILNTDRPMQYVHLKDMRAAGLEPVDVLSGYQWKNNLGYYQATKDASTNFYIYYMPKGQYVFEYDLVCNASGSFSSGFATLQNYYAPQMNARTEGDKIEINK